MIALPTATTSDAESPLTPVSTQSFSNTLHGPDGSATRDHLVPFQSSVSGVPDTSPTAHTSFVEIALIPYSGANGTLSPSGVVNGGWATVQVAAPALSAAAALPPASNASRAVARAAVFAIRPARAPGRHLALWRSSIDSGSLRLTTVGVSDAVGRWILPSSRLG